MLVPGIVPIYMGEGDDHILLREIVDDEAKEAALDPTAGEQGQAAPATGKGRQDKGSEAPSQESEDKWGT